MSVLSQDIIIITVLIQLFVMFTFVLISLVKTSLKMPSGSKYSIR